ncbi:hypothetical protein BO78DRAFT_398650 [Aspergillus sclerotiicarbonarius CBS 121057]|uniref:Uncharacterized protein n=1 Tax=Aspergillus sclerotiicarbonarius (strain CBS 121057 / IBT 28362) TaxID=1448318 RepID=A0A319E4D5_ASPSB|nr:hypothetical protein BO78DRAFT_398650 [Aspergillus sclerotiicarbonarius CBS 121057]
MDWECRGDTVWPGFACWSGSGSIYLLRIDWPFWCRRQIHMAQRQPTGTLPPHLRFPILGSDWLDRIKNAIRTGGRPALFRG